MAEHPFNFNSHQQLWIKHQIWGSKSNPKIQVPINFMKAEGPKSNPNIQVPIDFRFQIQINLSAPLDFQ